MAQVTIYMDDETEARMRAAARDAGLSMSAWLAGLIRERTNARWPQEVIDAFGSWPDLPTAEEMRADLGVDAPREEL